MSLTTLGGKKLPTQNVGEPHDLNVSGAWGVSAFGFSWISAAVLIYRGYDESGAVSLAALLYFLSFVFLVVLQCFMPSKHQNNGYGSPPAYFA